MTRNEVQEKAIENWVSSGKKGTVLVATGIGKTFIFLHALYTMPRNDGKIHLFLAETTSRKDDLDEQIRLYNKIFNRNVNKDYNLQFYCYQTVWKWKSTDNLGLVGADEVHCTLSEQYCKFFFNNKYDAVLGMTATVNLQSTFLLDGIQTTKGQILYQIAPICFEYTLAQAKEDSISRNLNIYVIYQDLDEKTKNIPAGNAVKQFFQTEKQAYSFWDRLHQQAWFVQDREEKTMKIRVTASKRSKLLFKLPSKVKSVQQILNTVTGKTIVFGNDIDSLLQVTPNVVSSRNKPDENKAIREAFDNDSINVIGSFKKLIQGANLKSLDNCIIMSYFSSEGEIIQKLGRLRQDGDKIGNAFILLTRNTQEEQWFAKMIENLNNFNFIYCENMEQFINKYRSDA